MSHNHSRRTRPRISVAGDVWIDWVGLEKPHPKVGEKGECTTRGRSTNDTGTSFLPGGAMLVEHFVKAAVPKSDVRGHQFKGPAALVSKGGPSGERLTSAKLIELAARLTDQEMPRSLLSLKRFAERPNQSGEKREAMTRTGKKPSPRVWVETRRGWLGSKRPTLTTWPPAAAPAQFVVLDDTRDEFRNRRKQWPSEIVGGAEPVVVHKLHRPFPGSKKQYPLWALLSKTPDRHIVIISIDDLRRADTPISRGLSWERTALDVVWQLLNADKFAVLRVCRHLIVRFGINGALYWRAHGGSYEASLIYDPAGIEGSAEQLQEGQMVGYGSAFVAGVLKHLVKNHRRRPDVNIKKGVITGLIAGRRLLKLGFEVPATEVPCYPGSELFARADKDPHKRIESHEYFAERSVPVLLGATEPDPGYWRLLDDLVPLDSVKEKEKFDKAAASVVKDGGQHRPTLLQDVPIAVFEKFRTCDRREIEQYRALYNSIHEYILTPRPSRPLNVAVFGPPGAGKSFGVKQLASALKASLGGESAAGDWAGLYAPRPTEELTFNLSQYKHADELAAAFHQVRDKVLGGSIPLVFFDEFDTALDGVKLGWLRYFLGPMQDASFLDRGLPHPIGQAIFVFAGGTCHSYEEFRRPLTRPPDAQEYREFTNAKGPDFLSRLRAALDIPGLDLDQTFNSYGSVELFPCEVAIKLRRASVLKLWLHEKEKLLPRIGGDLRISDSVIRALLKLREFRHGNRSFEALLDMSHLQDAKGSDDGKKEFFPSSLPAPWHTDLHASARELSQLVAECDHFPEDEANVIAEAIKADASSRRPRVQGSYQMKVEDIPRILRLAGCEFRKAEAQRNDSTVLDKDIATVLWRCPELEHDRWVAQKRRKGYVCGKLEAPDQLRHPSLVPWGSLPGDAQEVYTHPIFKISEYLKQGGYVVIRSGQAD